MSRKIELAKEKSAKRFFRKRVFPRVKNSLFTLITSKTHSRDAPESQCSKITWKMNEFALHRSFLSCSTWPASRSQGESAQEAGEVSDTRRQECVPMEGCYGAHGGKNRGPRRGGGRHHCRRYLPGPGKQFYRETFRICRMFKVSQWETESYSEVLLRCKSNAFSLM